MNLKKLLTTLAIVSVVLIAGCKKDDFVEVIGVCPAVISTSPVNVASGVPLNKIVTATFSKKMNGATITPTSYTLQQGVTLITGTVTYTDSTASFTPSSPLSANTTYTGTVKASVKDKTGNALVADYIWTFNTGIVPMVISVDPLNLATGVVLNKLITGTFSQVMDPLTITSSTFTLRIGLIPVLGAVTYAGSTATFTPTVALLPGTLYTATITTGARNTTGIAIASDYVWTFTTSVIAPCPTIVELGLSGNYVILAESGISTTGLTSVTGNMGINPAAATTITGFGLILPAGGAFSTSSLVTGNIYAPEYAPPTPANLVTATNDMHTAYTTANGLVVPAPVNEYMAGNLNGQTLTKGIYKWSSNVGVTNGIILDGGADNCATFIFQIAGDLTIANSAIITLQNGAQAKNIFWVVAGSGAVLGTNVDFSGNILCKTLISLNTGAKVTGRLLAQTAVTLNASIVILP
jgi:hypothetical protein